MIGYFWLGNFLKPKYNPPKEKDPFDDYFKY